MKTCKKCGNEFEPKKSDFIFEVSVDHSGVRINVDLDCPECGETLEFAIVRDGNFI